MKNLFLLICLFFSIQAISIAQTRASNSSCGWEAWIDGYCEKTYTAGKNLTVKVQAKNHHRIKYMELYINGDLVGKETGHPYDWGKPGKDRHLKNMRSGTYKIEVKIVDHCGKVKYIKNCKYYVKHEGGNTGGNNCHYLNLHWIKDIKYKHPNHNICEYNNNGHTYYRVYPCNQSHYTEYWYDCYGKEVCHFQNGYACNKVKYAKKVKCWYEPCHSTPTPCTCPYLLKPVCGSDGKTYDNYCLAECAGVTWTDGGCGTGTGDHCDFDVWYDHPKKKGHRWYVKVNVSAHHQIKYVDLYVNGRHAGKETGHPYDWGKQGKDRYLTNLRHGTYKLTCKIYTTCGHVVEKHHEFRVSN